nr:MAG: GNAT family N-acetyltransferase [Chloroflexota bacterium]
MTAQLTVRHVRPADIPAIHAIYAHSVLHGTASWEYEPPDLDEMRRRVEGLLERGFPYLVAEVDGAVAGYCYCGPYRPRAGYRYVVEDSIFVASNYQRRGIARTLLATLIEEATQRGYRQMVAVIGDSANVASIALHRALGFTHAGTLAGIGFKFGRWLDSVLMQRPLGAGSAAPPDHLSPA